MIRVVHYVNQFFGGVGGEEQAHVPPRAVEGPLGPGLALRELLDGGLESLDRLAMRFGRHSLPLNLFDIVTIVARKVRPPGVVAPEAG